MIDRIPLLADDLFVALSSGDKKMGLLVIQELNFILKKHYNTCLLYTSPSPRD